MRGDDRVRYCSICSQSVYDLSAMTTAEAATLIRDREGDLCVRLFRRTDGTVLTSDCPVGFRQRFRRSWRWLAAVPISFAAAAAAVAAWLFTYGPDQPLNRTENTRPVQPEEREKCREFFGKVDRDHFDRDQPKKEG
jgi:hypothetical protein